MNMMICPQCCKELGNIVYHFISCDSVDLVPYQRSFLLTFEEVQFIIKQREYKRNYNGKTNRL